MTNVSFFLGAGQAADGEDQEQREGQHVVNTVLVEAAEAGRSAAGWVRELAGRQVEEVVPDGDGQLDEELAYDLSAGVVMGSMLVEALPEPAGQLARRRGRVHGVRTVGQADRRLGQLGRGGGLPAAGRRCVRRRELPAAPAGAGPAGAVGVGAPRAGRRTRMQARRAQPAGPRTPRLHRPHPDRHHHPGRRRRTGALHRPGGRPAALRSIEDSSRAALEDLDYVLGVLREEAAGAAPTRTLADLPELLERLRHAGAVLEPHLSDDLDRVQGTLSRAAYRILQESLTNALRHGAGGPIQVSVTTTPDLLELDVVNPTRDRTGPGPFPTSGHGLAGLAERVRLLNGRLDARPDGDGHWRTTARLPLQLPA